MSRFQYTNRNLELLEPYEWKRSRTVLRGESGSNVADLPDRPSDLEQRDGRGIRKGNDIAKLYANNKVDVIIYAVEKSLDAYKFGLLHNKQLFIRQLKNNSLGNRTIDEGSMDEKGGMNFSEYVAILSGNTELLEKARLEKKIASLESERQAFTRGKSSSRFKLEDIMSNMEKNSSYINRISSDMEVFNSRVQFANDGTRLNPVILNGLQGSNPKEIGQKLNEIADNARTYGAYENIGTLYGFQLLVKSETTVKDGFDLIQNRFFVKGEGEILYNYNHGNMATDPKTAALNFLNALDTMPKLLEKYQVDNEKLQKDIPTLKEVVEANWRKEPELKALKDDLVKLEREIQLSLKPIEESEGHAENTFENGMSVNGQKQPQGKTETVGVQNVSTPYPKEKIKSTLEDSFAISSASNPLKVERKETSKGIKL